MEENLETPGGLFLESGEKTENQEGGSSPKRYYPSMGAKSIQERRDKIYSNFVQRAFRCRMCGEVFSGETIGREDAMRLIEKGPYVCQFSLVAYHSCSSNPGGMGIGDFVGFLGCAD